MDFLGVGPMELFFIVIIALIILGPRDMEKAGRTLGKWMNTLVRSDTWKLLRQASNKIKYLPNELMREAGMDEIRKAGLDLNREVKQEMSKEISPEVIDPFKAWKEPQANLNLPVDPVIDQDVEKPATSEDGVKPDA